MVDRQDVGANVGLAPTGTHHSSRALSPCPLFGAFRASFLPSGGWRREGFFTSSLSLNFVVLGCSAEHNACRPLGAISVRFAAFSLSTSSWRISWGSSWRRDRVSSSCSVDSSWPAHRGLRWLVSPVVGSCTFNTGVQRWSFASDSGSTFGCVLPMPLLPGVRRRVDRGLGIMSGAALPGSASALNGDRAPRSCAHWPVLPP